MSDCNVANDILYLGSIYSSPEQRQFSSVSYVTTEYTIEAGYTDHFLALHSSDHFFRCPLIYKVREKNHFTY